MPTFIDERGDTGHPPGGSDCFQLAAVWLPTASVEPFRSCIRVVRVDLGLPADYEFKFVKTGPHPERRAAFFQAALAFPFRFAFAAVDKRRPDLAGLDHAGIQWAAVADLAATLRPFYLGQLLGSQQKRLHEPIIVDNNDDGQFLAIVKETFRGIGKREIPPLHLIGKVRFRESSPDELIQLADMVVGACGLVEEGNRQWYNVIANRDLGVTRQ